MTAVISRPDADRAPTSARVFGSVIAVTIVVTFIALATPRNDTVALVITALVLAFLGIPHGAVDHLVATPPTSSASADASRPTGAARQWRFHVGYVAAMFAYGVVWLLVPAFALVGFLVLSVHHFGQSDLAYLRIGGRQQTAIQISRGLFLVGVPLVVHLESVGPVIERLGGMDPSSWGWLDDHAMAWCVVLVGQHVVMGMLLAPWVRGRSTRVREIATVAVLTTLFVTTDPLIGFAVYFGLWHSLNHLHVLVEALGRRSGSAPMDPLRLARLAAPRSLVSIAGLALFVGGAHVVDRPDLVVPAAVIFVSMLTLPHMVVVERLWRSQLQSG